MSLPSHEHRRKAEQKPLADQLAELVNLLVPAGHIYTGAQRGKFDSLYRELSKLDEKRNSR
jgi:hypothetical protein